MRRPSLAVPAVLVLALGGCGSGTTTKIDQTKAEGLVRKVAGSGRIQLESVSCPQDQEAKANASFDCAIEYADGARGTMTIHMTNDDGGVRTSASDIHVTK